MNFCAFGFPEMFQETGILSKCPHCEDETGLFNAIRIVIMGTSLYIPLVVCIKDQC